MPATAPNVPRTDPIGDVEPVFCADDVVLDCALFVVGIWRPACASRMKLTIWYGHWTPA